MAKNKYRHNTKPAHEAPAKPQAAPHPASAPSTHNHGRWIDASLPTLSFILFALWAAYMLIARNSDYLYTASEHTLWIADRSFFDMTMVKPGGLITWLGCLLTQFFHHPALGSSMLIAIWAATYVLTIRAFRLSRQWMWLALLPVALMLCSETCIGYWLYYIKMPGYWFVSSLGLLFSVAAIAIHTRLSLAAPRWVGIVWLLLWSAVGYIATGWWALLAVTIMAIMAHTRGASLIAAAAGIAAVPILSYQYYTQMRIEDAWRVGFPMFQIDKYISWKPMLPFIIILCLLVIMAIAKRLSEHKQLITKTRLVASIGSTVTLAAIISATLWTDFDNTNFHTEMRMYRAADEGRWADVLQEAHNNPTAPTREIVMLKNVALTYQGNIGNYMFKYDNKSIPPYTYDSLAVRMVQTNAPLIYYYYARLNFATRWCIENGVETGFTPDIYKVLTRCALVAGETDLASKYVNILKKTIYHHTWASHYEPMLADTALIAQSGEFDNQREYYAHFRSMLDGDEGLVEMYLLQYFSQTMNKDSRLLQETTLIYALQSKDISLFWPRFFLYAHLHPNEPMPIHYQEAAYLYGNLEHEVDISGMPFDDVKIRQRYASFNQISQTLIGQGKSVEEVGQIMKPSYGDTFWWFYFFCRGINSY